MGKPFGADLYMSAIHDELEVVLNYTPYPLAVSGDRFTC